MSLLKEWHEHCSEKFAESAEVLRALPGISQAHDGRIIWNLPLYHLPAWTEHLGPEKRKIIESRLMAQILDSYLSRFRPHPPGHIRALVALREHYEQDEGVEGFGVSLCCSEPLLKNGECRNCQQKGFSQPVSTASNNTSLALRLRDSPSSLGRQAKRPLRVNNHKSGSRKKHKSEH
jgi:hypothetical protein